MIQPDSPTTADAAEEPPIVMPYLAYFFVPLHEPLGLPDGWVLRIHEPTPAHWWRRDDTPLPPTVHTAGSLLFHRAKAPSSEREWPRVLFDIAVACLPDTDQPTRPEDDSPEAPATELSVVEMAVAFDHDVGNHEVPNEDGATSFDDAVSDAFDRGVAWVREVQRAYYATRRVPSKLITRESMPFAIPLGIRQLADENGEPLAFKAPLSMYFLHSNVVARDPDLSDAEVETLTTALREQASDGVFTQYINYQREAKTALAIDGSYATAVLFTATACEVLLDDLLAHMLWQEGLRPEQAAPFFDDDFLQTRVKKHYHNRLGGNWSIDTPGPIRKWAVAVAALRNRVVHAGYEPTLLEAREATDAAQELQDYLSDLLAAKCAIYPRTALRLPGEYGLRRRNRWTKRLDALRNDPSEVPWTSTFARWRLAMQRARRDSPLAATPSISDSWILLVVHPDGATKWVIHDRSAGLAAVTGRDFVQSITSAQQASLDAFIKAVESEGVDEALSTVVHGATVTEAAIDAWVPEYRLVPMAGVMVDGRDLD